MSDARASRPDARTRAGLLPSLRLVLAVLAMLAVSLWGGRTQAAWTLGSGSAPQLTHDDGRGEPAILRSHLGGDQVRAPQKRGPRLLPDAGLRALPARPWPAGTFVVVREAQIATAPSHVDIQRPSPARARALLMVFLN